MKSAARLGREGAEHLDAVDGRRERGRGGPVGASRSPACGHSRRARRHARRRRSLPGVATPSGRIASGCVRPPPRACAGAPAARHAAHRQHRGDACLRAVVVVPGRHPDRGGDGADGRAGAARARGRQVRRRPGVRGGALRLGAAARGVARADGTTVRLPGELDPAELPRGPDRGRGRGALAAPRGPDRGGRPADLDRRRHRGDRPVVRHSRRVAADGRRRPGLGQPARRRHQPRARPAAGRWPRPEGARVGRVRQSPPRHHRRRLGRPPGSRRGAAPGPGRSTSSSTSRRPSSTSC